MFAKIARRFFSTQKERLVERILCVPGNEHIVAFELNNPKQKNALSQELVDDLADAIKVVKSDEKCRAVIVMSRNPGMFCAGGDLKEMLRLPSFENEQYVTRVQETFNMLHHLQVPVIAAIDGAALGGGLELALSCDIRVCSKNALLGLPEVNFNMIPAAGGLTRMSRIVGIAKAKELIYTGKRLTADEALALGLVNYVEEDFVKTNHKAIEIANNIILKGPVAIRAAKTALNCSTEIDLATGLAVERVLYSKIVDTEDRMEGLKAFLEKRIAEYQGR